MEKHITDGAFSPSGGCDMPFSLPGARCHLFLSISLVHPSWKVPSLLGA